MCNCLQLCSKVDENVQLLKGIKQDIRTLIIAKGDEQNCFTKKEKK